MISAEDRICQRIVFPAYGPTSLMFYDRLEVSRQSPMAGDSSFKAYIRIVVLQ
jgi:hypothetical protein